MDVQDEDTLTEKHDAPGFVQPLLDRLRASAKTETVFGPSRTEGSRRIVPVAKVSYGAGGGAGTSKKRDRSLHEKGAPNTAETGTEEGAGGGAGISVNPLGVFEVTDQGLRFVPVDAPKAVALGAFLGGLLLGMALVSRRRAKR